MRAPREGRGGVYAAGIAGTLAATALSVLAGVAGLWLLNRVLSKEMFGGYAFAMNLALLATLLASLGLDRTLMLRVAGYHTGGGALRGWGLLARAGIWAAGAAVLLAAAGAAVAGGLAPGPNAYWLLALAPALPFLTLTYLLRAWLQANHRTGISNTVPGLADGVRTALIALVWLLGGGPAWVAAAVISAAALPAVGLVGLLLGQWLGQLRRAPRRLPASHVVRGLPFVVQSLSAQGMVLLDVVVVGFATPGAVTADYALAARLAMFADSARLALKPTFTARARQHFARGDRALLAREYHALRVAGFLAALLFAAGITAFGRPVLEIFGPFASAQPALLVIAASHLVVGGAGMHTSVLLMSGELHASATIRAAALAALVASIALLAPVAGAAGAGLGLLLSQSGGALGTAILMRRRTGLAAMPAGALLRLVACVGTLLLAAAGALPTSLAAALLVALLLVSAWAEKAALGDLRALVAGRAAKP